MRKKLLAVDKELAMFAPYLIPWAGEVVRSPWKLVAIIEAAIEQCVEGTGSVPATRGALVHYSPVFYPIAKLGFAMGAPPFNN